MAFELSCFQCHLFPGVFHLPFDFFLDGLWNQTSQSGHQHLRERKFIVLNILVWQGILFFLGSGCFQFNLWELKGSHNNLPKSIYISTFLKVHCLKLITNKSKDQKAFVSYFANRNCINIWQSTRKNCS